MWFVSPRCVCARPHAAPTAPPAARGRTHRIRVLIFLVWMSYMRCTAALISRLPARMSTRKTWWLCVCVWGGRLVGYLVGCCSVDC
jgi:hypothetical protein